ncbi:aspartyl/glutamyl-tRNA(Asn/Gln) amidotransferase subunit B [Ekhidna lutea]|uniref:Aspartyl/glutamyl-tRNA(Asn/Gln) amidotransferase subunit B n=1 Tax=Ekhidna lutea TaxID=447679 RepID=A0A239M869_EKHLU|nr:Asp-tRNA(Asn)/Glu-tRNA(Gln) amidotransferase subunit GatB [Ekhidna lutea]SNT38945.1 aspartyl/glutamyl-tRNA(Asn/Gln) amidotransferase subunit B [Ekhidna lutea]
MSTEAYSEYQLVVGLEIHIQLSTESKLFTAESTAYGQPPNTNVSVITLAHPGIMPKLNKKAVEYAIRMGLACGCDISRYCIFDRKNYFYPDSPKGFQTTQDRTPICIGGVVPVNLKDGEEVNVKLNRIHLEEDAGKSIHDEHSDESFIDLNRAGVPLIELVTEPTIHSADEAMAFMTEIRRMVRYLEICDGNMEQGSLRCDANISVRKKSDTELGKKVEVKNMNSIRNVGRAIKHEFKRQINLVEEGKPIITETRLYDANTGTTFSMRTKEELNDYRYFPEPDLSPFEVTEDWLNEIRLSMPATPRQLRSRFVEEYGLSVYDTEVLTSEKEVAAFFEEVCEKTTHYKQVANWVMGPIKSILNEQEGDEITIPIAPEQLSELVEAVENKKINSSLAGKQVFPYLVNNTNKTVSDAISELKIDISGQDDISDIILEVLGAFPEKVKAYQNGKKNLMGMFMGEVMKKTEGAANPQKANELLRDALDKKEKEE